jgi:hypothetical protein
VQKQRHILEQVTLTHHLFRIYEDPNEANDLAAQHPDVVETSPRASTTGAASTPSEEPEQASSLTPFRDRHATGPTCRRPWARSRTTT